MSDDEVFSDGSILDARGAISPISPIQGPSLVTLPCVVDGAVAIQVERLASVISSSDPEGCEKSDSGMEDEVLVSTRARLQSRQPITSSDTCPLSLGDLSGRKSPYEQEVASPGSCSPSPRDGGTDALEPMSPFYSFLHSKGLADCCQYFPSDMSLAHFAQLTEFELINLFDIQSSHVREVVMHTIQSLDKPEQAHAEDDEVTQSFTNSSCTSTPPRSPSPRKFYDSTDVPSVVSRRLLHRTFSEDMKSRRRRESMPHSHSSHALSTLHINSISQSCGNGSDFTNLMRIRNSLLGHSAPNLTSSMKDISVSRRSSGRSAVSTPKKMTVAHPRSISPQTNLSASPIEVRATGSPLPPPPVQNLKKMSSAADSTNRRWSVASSGYSTTTGGSNSLTSSMERVNPFFSAHDLLSTEPSRERFSSSESNPPIEDDSSLLSPLPRPRSRSFSCSASIFSPTRAMLLDADSTFMMNSVYRERFPKAVRQMEEKLRQFIAENTAMPATQPQTDDGDGILSFVHKQIVHLAQDCLDKSENQLLSALYFHELTENLRTLCNDVKSRASAAVNQVDKISKTLLMIVSRAARLLECLEFDPDEFYCLLEQAEGQAKKTINTSDIPKYIVNKLKLNRDPLEAMLPDELDDFQEINLDDTSDSLSTPRESSMKVPVEEDFEYIKQISNGAYGVVWLVRHKYDNQRFAIKKLLKTNLVLRNQVEQVFNERDILTFADNPFVVSLYGSFETKKHLCLVMEYVEGGDCAALIKNMGGPLPLDMARLYFAETVLALEYIHDYGIVHRDLKPDNLLITNEGHIKLTDFGLSKMGIMNLTTNLVEGILDRESKQFNDRQIFGTPEYIAPEVILRQGYGKPVDWWSMGIILYEFLVGCVPFYGDTPDDLFQMVLTADIEFPEEEEYALPSDAHDLILRLLERDPLKRLGTTGARSVMEHYFVSDIDWDSLLRQKAEFVPNLEGEDDTSYFDLRADRFPQHNDYDDDSDEDIMISSFSSCSPRYSKVYQKVQEMKNQQEHDSLSRQSSDSSSVFGVATQISSDSGSDSPRVTLASDKVNTEDFSFSKSPEILKSSLKSNTSTPKRLERRSDSSTGLLKQPGCSISSADVTDISGKRAASRSVSFDSEISMALDHPDSSFTLASSSALSTPLSLPTSPNSDESASTLHKALRRSDALAPSAAEVIQKKNFLLRSQAIDEELRDEEDEGDDDAFEVETKSGSAYTPTTCASSPTTPIQFDVIPSTSAYTPVPVTQVVTSPLSPISPVGQSNLSTLTASVTSASQTHYPTAAETTSISLPAGILDNHTSTTTSKAADCTSTTPTSTSCTDRNLSLPFGLVKSHLQVNSSSDSASSSSANNSPGSSLSISQKSNRKNKPNCRLHRNKQPNMLLAKVSEKGSRPRSRTTPDCYLDYGDRHHSLPEVSISASSPSPPSREQKASNPQTIETLLKQPPPSHRKQSLYTKRASNSCPVPVPSAASSQSNSMFVKSASATQLSLLIPPPSEDFSYSTPSVLLSPTSSASSRDQSPTRDALRRPPFILKKGSRGYGFFLKAIRVYSGDGHYYHINHLITSVAEGSSAYQAGLRANFLVTHINNEAVHGLPQPQIVRLIQKNNNMVTLRALPIEETSLKSDVKPPSELRKAKMVSRRAIRKKQSFGKVDRQRRQRSSSLLKTLSKRNVEHMVQPSLETRLMSPRCSSRLPPEIGLSQSFSSASASPLSSGPNSPANSFTSRPGTLQGLSKSMQNLKSPSRRKSVHNIPLSPLARTPSPSPMTLSPTSHNPTSKLAVHSVKTGSNPSTLTFKHSPRLNKNSVCCSSGSVERSTCYGSQGVKVVNTFSPSSHRSQHNALSKTESSQSDPGKVMPTKHTGGQSQRTTSCD